jgi:cysteine synthase A
VIVIPDNQSPEKMELLRALGAEVRPVPPKPYADPDNYQKIAGRLAAETPNAIWANQFDNLANRQAETTGADIWRATLARDSSFASRAASPARDAGSKRSIPGDRVRTQS